MGQEAEHKITVDYLAIKALSIRFVRSWQIALSFN